MAKITMLVVGIPAKARDSARIKIEMALHREGDWDVSLEPAPAFADAIRELKKGFTPEIVIVTNDMKISRVEFT